MEFNPIVLPPIVLPKGQRTSERVLREALRMAGQFGFRGLTFGTLAQTVGLSKSGLFAHFASMEDLQLQTLALAEREWQDHILRPALAEPRGMPRLRRLFEEWVGSIRSAEFPAGSVLISASFEFDDIPPCLMRDAVLKGHREMTRLLERLTVQAVEAGHLDAGVDAAQFAFEFRGLIHAHHHQWKLLRVDAGASRARTALDRLVAWSAPVRQRKTS